MKKLVAFVCAAVMSLGLVSTAMANPSITEVVESEVTVIGGTGKVAEGLTISVQEADPEKYANEKVAEVVKAVNDEEELITLEEIAEILEIEEEQLITNKENEVKLDEYSLIAKFMDLATDAEDTKFEMAVEGTLILEIQTDLLKDVDVEDLEDYLIMFIDQETAEVKFIELEKDTFDPETGKLEVEFPGLGVFTILQKTAE